MTSSIRTSIGFGWCCSRAIGISWEFAFCFDQTAMKDVIVSNKQLTWDVNFPILHRYCHLSRPFILHFPHFSWSHRNALLKNVYIYLSHFIRNWSIWKLLTRFQIVQMVSSESLILDVLIFLNEKERVFVCVFMRINICSHTRIGIRLRENTRPSITYKFWVKCVVVFSVCVIVVGVHKRKMKKKRKKRGSSNSAAQNKNHSHSTAEVMKTHKKLT